MENYFLKQFLSGVVLIIFALISDNVVRADVNFKSRPTTIKTFENDSVLLPCYSTGKEREKNKLKIKIFLVNFFLPCAKIFFFPSMICFDYEKYFAFFSLLSFAGIFFLSSVSDDGRNLIMKNYFRELR